MRIILMQYRFAKSFPGRFLISGKRWKETNESGWGKVYATNSDWLGIFNNAYENGIKNIESKVDDKYMSNSTVGNWLINWWISLER